MRRGAGGRSRSRLRGAGWAVGTIIRALGSLPGRRAGVGGQATPTSLSAGQIRSLITKIGKRCRRRRVRPRSQVHLVNKLEYLGRAVNFPARGVHANRQVRWIGGGLGGRLGYFS